MTLGNYLDEEVVVNSGRYGPYVKFKEKFISLPKGVDPLEFTFDEAKELIDAREKADAPIASYKGLDVVRGKGRFGPFLKWNEMFINIPRRINAENITQEQIFELVEAKIEKEANRYIMQWPEDKIALENGRWGPFIRHKKKSYKLPRKENGDRYNSEEAKEKFNLEEIKKILKEEGAKGIK